MSINGLLFVTSSIAAIAITSFGCQFQPSKREVLASAFKKSALTSKGDWKITAPGIIEPFDGVKRLAPSIGLGGAVPVVEQLMVEEGDKVLKNKILAVLDSNMEITKELRLERQRVISLNKELEILKLQTQRYAILQKVGAIPDAEYEDRLLRRQRLETDIDTAVSRIEVLKQRLKRTYILAPHDGLVLEIYAREGEQAGEEGLLALVNNRNIGVLAQVEERYANKLRIGDHVAITSENGLFHNQLNGKIIYIANHVSRRRSFFTRPGGAKDSEPRVFNIKVAVIDRSGVDIEKITGAKVMVHFHQT